MEIIIHKYIKYGLLQLPDSRFRYAEFTATCLALHASPGLESLGLNSGGEDMLSNDVKTLTRDVVTLLQRLAERHRGAKERYVFLINNYDQVRAHR